MREQLRHRHVIVASLAAVAGIAASAQAGEAIDVPVDFPTIQAALDQLPVGGEHTTIFLEPGVYHENVDVTGKNVTIIGNPFNTDAVVIDGLGDTSTITLRDVAEDYLVTILGVTITGGTGTVGPTPQLFHTYGGGVHLEDGTSIRIHYSVVRDNTAWYGGGIYANSDSRVELLYSTVSGNYAEYHGGGLTSLGDLVVEHCTFVQNEGFVGGHITLYHKVLGEALIENSTFRNGFALERDVLIEAGMIPSGGAIMAEVHGPDAMIRNCVFEHNISAGQGGAIGCGPYDPNQLEACALGQYPCPDGSLLVEDCSFTNCMASKGGGIAWYQRGRMDVTGSSFDTCVATIGGGVSLVDGENSIRDSSFVNCGTLPGGQGAGIACESSALELLDSSIEVCMAHEGVGGGISLVDSAMDMRDCLLRGNEAEESGSGLHALRSSVQDQGSEIIDHVTSTAVFLDMESSVLSSEFNGTLFQRNGYYAAFQESRGAVYLLRERGEDDADQPRCQFTGCTFDRNESAVHGGGAIRTVGMDVEVGFSEFLSNNTLTAETDGGAINVQGAEVALMEASFDRNIASRDGGAIYLDDAVCSIRWCDFTSNYAENYGGSIKSEHGTVLAVENCTFVGGASTGAIYGGAIDIDVTAGAASIDSVSITGCSAEFGGGGIYSDSADTQYSRCLISGNSAAVGGGVCSTFGGGIIEQSRICGNVVDQIQGPFVDGGDNAIAEACCSGDLDGDGIINGSDLTLLLGEFGTDGDGFFGSDINGDGIVDGADLAILLGDWGGCN